MGANDLLAKRVETVATIVWTERSFWTKPLSRHFLVPFQLARGAPVVDILHTDITSEVFTDSFATLCAVDLLRTEPVVE